VSSTAATSELKQRFERECGPDCFFVDPADAGAIANYLRALDWIGDDRVVTAERIGDGNMNLTVRVRLERRSVVLKQARPWVEKYPAIPAPFGRASVEAAFYQAVTADPLVSGRMPALLGVDRRSSIILLEDLADAADLMPLYSSERLSEGDLAELNDYLSALHALGVDPNLREIFENRQMRVLNYEHQYDVPLRHDNGLDLDQITPGLARAATGLKSDSTYQAAVADLGRLYLDQGDTLVHGDFFPGSWLRHPRGLFVIDPEFCFLGRAEYDLGIFYAHLILAHQEHLWGPLRDGYSGTAAWRLAERFAGAELMRRLIGVAQLPLREDLDQKRAWLDRSRTLVCGS
jgi:5-methylthioribose kinase